MAKREITGNEIASCLPKESWFRQWLKVWPLTESPKPFVLFGGMAALGAALGRKVWFHHDVHTVYPMLNLLIIGPSGLGKSTAAGLGFRLLEAVPKVDRPQIIGGAATLEKLHDDLHANPHAILFASELANLFTKQKYMEGMIPYVTELLDYKSEQSRRTKGGGLVTVVNPSVTVIGCSTVDWLQEQLPDSATSGGFLARFLIVSEEHKSQHVPLPGKAMGKTQRAKLEMEREKVMAEFYTISQSFSGEIDLKDYGVADVYSKWYENHKPANGHLAPFAARAGEMVLRMSILMAVSCDRLYITEEDVESAIALYSYAEKKLQEVVVPFTVQGKLLMRVLQAVGEYPVTDITIRRAMKNYCGAQEVDKLVDSLMKSRDLQRTPDGKIVKVI